MFLKRFIIAATMLFGFSAHADSGFGFNLGIGLPYIGQGAIQYFFNDKFQVAVEYNNLDVDVDTAGVELTMPAIMAYYHPWGGSYFIGAGLGTQSLEATSTDLGSGNQVTTEVDSMSTIIKTGWMWGKANGGFWFGIDVSYIMPSGDDVTITAPGVPTNSQAYLDAVEAAEDFGDTAYTNITFARFGWMF